MPWPDDRRYFFRLHSDPRSRSGEYRVFVTVQKVRASAQHRPNSFRHLDDDGEPIPLISRLADRIDLYEAFRTRDAARRAGYEVAARYAAGQLAADRFVEKRRRGDYHIIGTAAFVPEDLMWEPMLTIRRKSGPAKGATQTFDEETSPFRRNHFQSAEHAATFALEYGERMVIGLVGGLKV